MRRLEIQEILGRIPTPDIEFGQHMVDVLFQVGPTKGELPLCEGDLEPWERRRGIELAPWQAELLVRLSQAYMQEAHAARDWSALAPWPPARNMWRYVQDKKHEQQSKEPAKESNGPGKRHRNPPPGRHR